MPQLLKDTALISLLTLVSRILGLIRDASIAFVFGTSGRTDAFFIAFRPFDLVRKLFSEGVLSTSFIPVFSKRLDTKGREDALAMVFSFFCFLSAAGVIFILLGFIFAPVIVGMIAPGFDDQPVSANLTVALFRIMLPYVWCILLVALCMGVLNTLGNFSTPAWAPVLFNLIIIVSALVVCNRMGVGIKGLAAGVAIGGMVQLTIQIPMMVRCGMVGFKPVGSFSLFFQRIHHPGMVDVLKRMGPCMVGAAAYQINIMIASFFASGLSEGSVSYLYYADRLVQFPIALFAVSVATVFLPELSRKARLGGENEISLIFTNGAKLVFFISFPAMFGLMALDYEITRLLFGQGRFQETAIAQTSDCLFYLVTGLWAFTGSRIFVTLYFALSQFRLPFFSGIISMGMNVSLCFLLGQILGFKGLVFSVVLSSAIGFTILFLYIPGNARIDKRDLFVSACRSLFISVIMAFLVEKLSIIWVETAGKIANGTQVAVVVLFGITTYLGLHLIFKTPESKLLKKGFDQKRYD